MAAMGHHRTLTKLQKSKMTLILLFNHYVLYNLFDDEFVKWISFVKEYLTV